VKRDFLLGVPRCMTQAWLLCMSLTAGYISVANMWIKETHDPQNRELLDWKSDVELPFLPGPVLDNPNSSRFGPPLRAVPRYHAEGPRTSSHVHSGSEPFCTDDTSVDGNSSTEEAPNISREIKSAVSDAISNQPDAGKCQF